MASNKTSESDPVIGALSADDALMLQSTHQMLYCPGPSMLICKQHSVNLSSSSLGPHLRQKHQIDNATANRIQVWTASLPKQLHGQTTRELTTFASAHDGHPFPGLTMTDGFSCLACKGRWTKKINTTKKKCAVTPDGKHTLSQAKLQILNTGNSPVMVAVSPSLSECMWCRMLEIRYIAN